MGILGRLFGKKEATPAPLDTTAKDPVCGMTVKVQGARFQSTHGAHTAYFCSAGCKTKFDKDPHAYLGAHAH